LSLAVTNATQSRPKFSHGHRIRRLIKKVAGIVAAEPANTVGTCPQPCRRPYSRSIPNVCGPTSERVLIAGDSRKPVVFSRLGPTSPSNHSPVAEKPVDHSPIDERLRYLVIFFALRTLPPAIGSRLCCVGCSLPRRYRVEAPSATDLIFPPKLQGVVDIDISLNGWSSAASCR